MATYWPIDPTILLPVAREIPRRLIVTPMKDGPPKTRLRNEGAPGALSGTIRVPGADLAAFILWGEETLLKWSQAFRWRDPLDGLVRTMQFPGEPSGLPF